MSSSTDRTGLYIVVFIILLNTCRTDNRTERIEQQVYELHQRMLLAENVVGEEGPIIPEWLRAMREYE